MTDQPVPDVADLDLVQVLRALADPTRLDIVTVLADGRPHPKRVDAWGTGVTKSTMSHHFKVLREAGLTRTLVEGRAQFCELRRADLDARFPGLVEALTRTGPMGDGRPAVRTDVVRDHLARTAEDRSEDPPTTS
ncbi:ArsR/SmtB family transcription factor [Microlunatus capsulatus]|uniref:DNA-binding transcriptional ArsR family regulator n=1 Tax=Microlunatus capsulatus TaxID=99117 RepID=A0ABS4Z2X9_9ACTN|nr:metalloregulator ArsR/SmtB family transcription factor [Microlunatus capsulatus]MBP2415402.1 DNA-binding transcriptional ArsR family regulator [Microlunatus capsulatus]